MFHIGLKWVKRTCLHRIRVKGSCQYWHADSCVLALSRGANSEWQRPALLLMVFLLFPAAVRLMGSIQWTLQANNEAHRGCCLNDGAIQVIASIDGRAQFSILAPLAQNETIIAIVRPLSRAGIWKTECADSDCYIYCIFHMTLPHLRLNNMKLKWKWGLLPSVIVCHVLSEWESVMTSDLSCI